jgi:hypothetical protein
MQFNVCAKIAPGLPGIILGGWITQSFGKEFKGAFSGGITAMSMDF